MHVEMTDHGELPRAKPQGSKMLTSPIKFCSYDGKVMPLVAEGRVHQLFSDQGCSERDGIDTMSSGSMSPDLGEWCPASPQWRESWNWTLQVITTT